MKQELLEILACPQCKGALQAASEQLLCEACQLAFPVVDDIPVLLLQEAQKLSEIDTPG